MWLSWSLLLLLLLLSMSLSLPSSLLPLSFLLFGYIHGISLAVNTRFVCMIEIGRFVVDFCLYTIFRWCWCVDNAKSVTKTIKVWHHSVLAQNGFTLQQALFVVVVDVFVRFYTRCSYTLMHKHTHIQCVFVYTDIVCVYIPQTKKKLCPQI